MGHSFRNLGMTINDTRNPLMGWLFRVVVLQVYVWGSPKEGQLIRCAEDQLALTTNLGQ